MENGFEIYPAVITPCECGKLIDALRGWPSRGRAGKRHLLKESAVRSIANDERVLSIAKKWIGPKAVPYRATLFEKSGLANWLVVWHQDTALPLEHRFESDEWGPWSSKEGIKYAHAPRRALERIIALRIHLDASTSFNGSLRVIPGSHILGVLDDGAVFDHAHKCKMVECLVPLGGVLAMRPLLIHSSSKAQNCVPRRVLHIEYADGLDIVDESKLAIA